MSRLDSMIRRLEAQRACLDWAMAAIADQPGPVLELGLGNGRTYDHLRAGLPAREILVFERRLIAHPDCIPDDAHLILGDLEVTLPPLVGELAGRVALIHADLGTAEPRYPASLEGLIAETFPRLLAERGVALLDKAIEPGALRRVGPPAGVARERYFIYRPRSGAGAK
jgi:hypothetical protein